MTAPEGIHSQWSEGYVVRVDPDDLVAESNNENNSYTVPGGTRLQLAWFYIEAPYEARNRVDFEMSAFIVSAGARRQVADWHITQDIDWGSCFDQATEGGFCVRGFTPVSPFSTGWFNIAGDEALEINVFIGHERPVRDDFGHTFTWLAAGETYGVEDGWGAATTRDCRVAGEVHGWDLGHFWMWSPVSRSWYEPRWYVSFNLCREDVGD
jgi:hypothetical protein